MFPMPSQTRSLVSCGIRSLLLACRSVQMVGIVGIFTHPQVNEWIDQQTRAVMLRFISYDGHNDILVNAQMLIKISGRGGFYLRSRIYCFTLLAYETGCQRTRVPVCPPLCLLPNQAPGVGRCVGSFWAFLAKRGPRG